ncbi:anti-sigma factor family protein [Chengkuizengella marina]|uniref:Zf-HC2 domain-containing protein n=1 Tax=Chengkuizengella marina TaxID=2507566 RepID=A0A6N9Q4F2_9BACL|nr:zf-HC2 domain-containing protein [Chengkuizengella marina]NBI29494.1 zf-HC2 domain-containing protein [Chengkuizengella marina]
MKCQEVIQLMQRDLDGDLNKEEQHQLMDHINGCHSCTEMFERLKHISSELEQLPKVTPPVSLVDQILPQLEEIDQVNIMETQAYDTGETEETSTTNTKRTSFTTLFKKARPTIAFLGTSAAAVILIVVLTLNSEDTLFNEVAEESASENIMEDSVFMKENTEEIFDNDVEEFDDQTALRIESEDANQSAGSRSGDGGESGSEKGYESESGEAFESGSEESIKTPFQEEEMTSITFSESFNHMEGMLSPDGQYVVNIRVVEEGGNELIVQKVNDQEILFTLAIEDHLTITKIKWLEDSQFILLQTSDGEKQYNEQIDIFNPMKPSQ